MKDDWNRDLSFEGQARVHSNKCERTSPSFASQY